MLRHRLMDRWVVCFCAVLLIAGLSSQVFGYEDRGRQRQARPEGARPEATRREQLKQEAEASAAEIKTALTQILEQVNQNQHPEPASITKAATLLEDNKRSAIAYDDSQKAEYMLLQAWTDFYQGNLDEAMNWSLRACKMDESNQDTWISQAVFCQLNGKRPIEPRIRRPDPRRERENEPMRRPRPRANGREMMQEANDGYADANAPYGTKGTLDFDMSGLRRDMLKERFGRLTLQAANGAKIEYTPGTKTLCLFFRQVKTAAAPADANDVARGREAERRRAEELDPMDVLTQAQDNEKLSLDNQAAYLGDLATACKSRPQIGFIQVNTNKQPAEAEPSAAVANVPLVYASNPASGAAQYAGVDADVPFMLIVDKEGVVRYAGPASDFMPALILSHLTGVQIPLEAGRPHVEAATTETAADSGLMKGLMERLLPKRGQVMPQREPNSPAMDPNHPAPAKPVVSPAVKPAQRPAVEPTKMTPEDEVAADHLLELAQMEIEACRTIRGKSPVQGVDACKEVLEKYPNTEYAERARYWLRRVPQRYWEKYKIADLLGY